LPESVHDCNVEPGYDPHGIEPEQVGGEPEQSPALGLLIGHDERPPFTVTHTPPPLPVGTAGPSVEKCVVVAVTCVASLSNVGSFS
jgi:hypothetical protein